MTRASRLLVLAALAAGCADEAPTRPTLPFSLAPIADFTAPEWTGTHSADDPVIARVEGVPIHASVLKVQLERLGPTAKPREVLERLIELELLAQAAFRSGHYTEPTVGAVVRRTLARRYVEIELGTKLTPADVPQEYVQKAYEQFRGRFDHFHRFLIHDTQVLCCTEVLDQDNCFREIASVDERRERLKSCLDDHADDARALYERLKPATAEGTGLEAVRQAFDLATLSLPNSQLKLNYKTGAAMQEYDMQYDVDSTYEKQFEKVRYRMLFKEIMDGVRKEYLDQGRPSRFIVPPIRTPIGWHIVYVDRVVPAQHLTATDPSVVAEIQSQAFTPWRRVYLGQTFEKLCRERECTLFRERLHALDEGP